MSERVTSSENKGLEVSLWSKAQDLLEAKGQELYFPPGRGFGQDIELELMPKPMLFKPVYEYEEVRLVVFERFSHKTSRDVGHLFWRRTEATSFEHRITISLRARMDRKTHKVTSLVLKKGEKPVFDQFIEISVPSGDPFPAKLPVDRETADATKENLEMFDRVLELAAKPERHFQVSEEKQRKGFIEQFIVHFFPPEEKDAVRERVNKIVNDFEGRDRDALSVLSYATEQERFDEFARQLEGFHEETFQYLHPGAKKPGVHDKVELFFTRCYTSLGIEPRE